MYSGQLITDRLRLVRQLGEGGMGSVWVAYHLMLDTEVAVKFTSAALGATEAGMARFEREARAAAKVKSPHVIKIFDYGCTVEGVPFIVMELLSGGDLGTTVRRSLAERQMALQPEFVCRVVEQAARGLAEAHEAGIVHRDIKPENIFISDLGDEPFVRLLDFGIAKHVLEIGPRLTRSQDSFGTPYTMSPEQVLRPKQVDFHTDLWSLAVVAYHALTGAWPFEGETLGELHIRIDKGVFAPPSTLRPQLPAALDAWFLRAFAHEPTLRFDSARELSETFSAALVNHPGAIEQRPNATERRSSMPVGLPPSDTMSPAISTPRRRREGSRRLMGMTLGAASLALGLLLWWLVAGPAEQASEASPSMASVAAKPTPPVSTAREPKLDATVRKEPAPTASGATPTASGATPTASSAAPKVFPSSQPSKRAPGPAPDLRPAGRSDRAPASAYCKKYGIDCKPKRQR